MGRQRGLQQGLGEDLGVDLTRVVLAQTNVMEEAYEIMLDALDTQSVDAVVLDSYPALIPTSEGDNAMDEWVVGLGARLTNKLMRKSPPAQRRKAEERNCLCLIINQWRDRIGVIFGDPRTTPGGKGKNFSYFTRVEVARDGWIDQQREGQGRPRHQGAGHEEQDGPADACRHDAVLLHQPRPFRKGGYDTAATLFNIALTYDIIERNGAWYSYGNERWNGKEAALLGIRADFDLQDALDTEVRKLVSGSVAPPEPSPPADGNTRTSQSKSKRAAKK